MDSWATLKVYKFGLYVYTVDKAWSPEQIYTHKQYDMQFYYVKDAIV